MNDHPSSYTPLTRFFILIDVECFAFIGEEESDKVKYAEELQTGKLFSRYRGLFHFVSDIIYIIDMYALYSLLSSPFLPKPHFLHTNKQTHTNNPHKETKLHEKVLFRISSEI